MNHEHLQELLERSYLKYNSIAFIDDDPISVPHRFNRIQDIEISGFFAATLAWGLRKTIIKKSLQLMELFDSAPYDFILNHTENDLKPLLTFKHRTFNSTDLLYFIHFFKKVYSEHNSLEGLFISGDKDDKSVKSGIDKFHACFIDDEFFPHRTGKHVASPSKNSACKRLNMFLRWMVRKDDVGVDFGIWSKIQPHQLICPCDVHVERVARSLGLVTRNQVDWKMATELTENLQKIDPFDPVKYDFALFGMGLDSKY